MLKKNKKKKTKEWNFSRKYQKKKVTKIIPKKKKILECGGLHSFFVAFKKKTLNNHTDAYKCKDVSVCINIHWLYLRFGGRARLYKYGDIHLMLFEVEILLTLGEGAKKFWVGKLKTNTFSNKKLLLLTPAVLCWPYWLPFAFDWLFFSL